MKLIPRGSIKRAALKTPGPHDLSACVLGVWLLAAALTLSLLFLPVKSAARDVTVVRVDGSAVKTDEVPDVKGAAIDQALKNAVAEALGAIIENEKIEVDPSLIEAKIYANSVSFVVNFKILSEERSSEEVEVRPEDLQAAPPVPPAPVEGIRPIVPGAPMPKAQEKTPLIKIVESYHIWIEARIDTVQLKDALGKIVLAREGSSPIISIVVLDITDYETYEALKESLKRVTLIKDVTYDSFYPGRFVFTARTAAVVPALVSRIAKETGKDFIVAQGPKGTIIIKAYPKALTID